MTTSLSLAARVAHRSNPTASPSCGESGSSVRLAGHPAMVVRHRWKPVAASVADRSMPVAARSACRAWAQPYDDDP